MKKLLCGLLLGWSSCLFPADLEKIINSIHKDYEKIKKESSDFTYPLEERTVARWILPLLIDGVGYENCEPSFIQKGRTVKNAKVNFVEEAVYNPNNAKVISYEEQDKIAGLVVAFIRGILHTRLETNLQSYCDYFSSILNALKHIDQTVFRNFSKKHNFQVKEESKEEESKEEIYNFNEFQLIHNKVLLDAFCFTLEVIFNFYKVYAKVMSDTDAIKAVTELIYEQSTSKKFEKNQYRAIIKNSFKGIQSMFNVDNQAIIEFLNEKVLTPDADIWAKLSTGKLGSSLLGGNNRRTPTASPSLQIAKVACGSAAVGTGVYALLETEKGNTLIRWMQKNPKKAGLLATMIAAPLLASVF